MPKWIEQYGGVKNGKSDHPDSNDSTQTCVFKMVKESLEEEKNMKNAKA